MQILQQLDQFNQAVPDFNNYLAYILACGDSMADEVCLVHHGHDNDPCPLYPSMLHSKMTCLPHVGPFRYGKEPASS